jgi:ATPase subunit of ABC transporter with duplicated ATPase domains
VNEPALLVKDVHKRYGSKRVLLGASFNARAGQLVAIVGENGSGKSTLLRILAGIEAADRGHVVREGTCGYCPQEPPSIRTSRRTSTSSCSPAPTGSPLHSRERAARRCSIGSD